ncbi:MAG: 30S ribosomal protein S6, partial [Clostridiales bacterium]|nr:30S ribosomal protein S6 [Clostridiales bacterium]
MNKYELALVLNAKIEDDARAASIDRVKDLITREGGFITEVEEWGKKKLAYDIQ